MDGVGYLLCVGDERDESSTVLSCILSRFCECLFLACLRAGREEKMFDNEEDNDDRRHRSRAFVFAS